MPLLLGNSHAHFMKPFLPDDWVVQSYPGVTLEYILKRLDSHVYPIIKGYDVVYVMFHDPHLPKPLAQLNQERIWRIISAEVSQVIMCKDSGEHQTRDGLHLTDEEYIGCVEKLLDHQELLGRQKLPDPPKGKTIHSGQLLL